MTPFGAPADGPLDDFDLAILNDVRDAFEQSDPMPADLPERIKFALVLRNLEAEVAILAADDALQPAGARGVEQSRTVTFDSASLTIMIRIESHGDGAVRVDGWLAPPERRVIELRTEADTLSAVSDEQGRFAFASVPHGTVQLIVREAAAATSETDSVQERAGSGRSVVTPALIL
jgi:hypothetical protein